MSTYLVICSTALLASGLTFFSGFGLGTLLLPAFVVFFPVELAVAMTGIVHFANGLFKLALIGRHAQKAVVLRFGIPAIFAALIGAWMLGALAHLPALAEYHIGKHRFSVTPGKLVIGVLLIAFTLAESLPTLRRRTFDPKWLPLGGALSGLFGGLSGHQGALRSAFLVKAGLSKEAFIATGVFIACLIDVTRLGVYSRQFRGMREQIDYRLLSAATAAAFVGAFVGNRMLTKVTMEGLRWIVGALVLLVGVGLASGLL